jgi:hypothetical protein
VLISNDEIDVVVAGDVPCPELIYGISRRAQVSCVQYASNIDRTADARCGSDRMQP